MALASVFVSGIAVAGCSSCQVIKNHKLTASPNPVGQPITFRATWDYSDGLEDPERHYFDLPGDFDLDGNGSFETRGATRSFTEDTFTRTFSAPATIKVAHAVRAEDDDSTLDSTQTDIVTQIVEVRSDTPTNQPPLADFFASPNPAPPCTHPGCRITLDASASFDPDGTITRYGWDINDDSILDQGYGSNPTTQIAFGGNGTYTVTLHVTDDKGSVSSVSRQIVVSDTPSVNQPPVASLTASPNPVKAEAPVTLDASASSDPDGTIAKYEFDLNGDGTYELDNGADATTSSQYHSIGNQTVGVRVTDNSGNTATDTVVVIVVAHRPRGAQVAAVPLERPREPVSIELTGGSREVRPGRFMLNGDELLNIGNTLKGKIGAGPFPNRLTRGKRKIDWASRSNIRTNIDSNRSVVRGVGLLEFPAGGMACLAYKLVVRDDKPGSGRFRVIGARGKAKRLRANGIGKATVGRDSMTLRGFGTVRFTKPWRTLGGFGCGKLRKL